MSLILLTAGTRTSLPYFFVTSMGHPEKDHGREQDRAWALGDDPAGRPGGKRGGQERIGDYCGFLDLAPAERSRPSRSIRARRMRVDDMGRRSSARIRSIGRTRSGFIPLRRRIRLIVATVLAVRLETMMASIVGS